MKWPSTILLLWMAAAIHGLSITNCRTDPTTDEYNSVQDQDDFTLTCTFDSDVEACTWMHYSPLLETIPSNAVPDVECTFAASQSSSNNVCLQRITGTTSGSVCSIRVSSSTNLDTGKWSMAAMAVTSMVRTL